MTDLAGAVVLVTGASGGIGRAIVDELTTRRANVIASGRDDGTLAELAARFGAHPLPADLAEPDRIRWLAGEATAVHGRVDVLINGAGQGWAGEFVAMEPALTSRLLVVDLQAPIALTHLLLPGMLERGGGHVVNLASIAGAVGVRSEAVYAAAKGGLLTFADSLRAEVAGHGIGVTSVLPGAVDTGFFDRRGLPYDRRWPRPVTPARVAAATIRAIERDREEVYVPAWLRLPARLHGAAPGLYRRLERRFE